MTDITKISDHCVIRWGAGVSPEAREELLARAAKLGKAKRVRAYKPNYPKERELAEGRGLRTIQADDLPEATPGAVWIVRIYYRSMGGEILACETDPITGAAATRLETEYGGGSCGPSDALGTDKYRAGDPKHITPLWKGARRVTLPSQGAGAVETLAEPLIPVETVAQAATALEGRPRRTLDYYRQAMTRRAARSGMA
jgi:hypothetical protein